LLSKKGLTLETCCRWDLTSKVRKFTDVVVHWLKATDKFFLDYRFILKYWLLRAYYTVKIVEKINFNESTSNEHFGSFSMHACPEYVYLLYIHVQIQTHSDFRTYIHRGLELGLELDLYVYTYIYIQVHIFRTCIHVHRERAQIFVNCKLTCKL
jgi:hypothetical protein